MKLDISSHGRVKVPHGCHISVQTGGVTKTAKFNGECSICLPDNLTEEHLEVELYQRLGTFTIPLTGSLDKEISRIVAEQSHAEGIELEVSAVPALEPQMPQTAPGQSLFGYFEFCSGAPQTQFAVISQDVALRERVHTPRMLVFTDVGEEIDDEAALWLLCQHFRANPNMEVDVVFVTGVPMQRATRWATILNSQADGKTNPVKLHYLSGPQSDRHMRYRTWADADQLRQADMSNIIQLPFDGGEYSVVLQLSPLGGFSDNFESPPTGSAGALSRIVGQDQAAELLHIVVGGVGSTNFPRDDLHLGFQAELEKKGFTLVHVEKSNYMNWEKDMFSTFPPKLVELVLDDEWNKAVGRIPPFVANLFVRFRVNTLVNYDVVDRAYEAFDVDHRSNPNYQKATKWWSSVADQVQQMVREGYIRKSREADDKQGTNAYGNGPVSEMIKGTNISWESLLSRGCIRDILGASKLSETSISCQTVDAVMELAVLLMTSKLLRIYAFNRFVSGRDPDIGQLEAYLSGTKTTAPLDFRNFPELHGDISSIQKEVVGNPMYDPTGMLIAIVAMSANTAQIGTMVDKLKQSAELISVNERVAAMKAAYNKSSPDSLVDRFFGRHATKQKTRPSELARRILVLTDAGEEADNEAALWLLRVCLDAVDNVEVDVVFTAGKPSLRSMRWARILNSQKHLPHVSRISYFAGPESTRPMRHQIGLDENVLKEAGMDDLAIFEGGCYRMVLQASPLAGFSDDFSNPPDGPEGALGYISLQGEKSGKPAYIVVGEEGSANFPKDKLHLDFKAMLEKQGFTAIHVNQENYVHWSGGILDFMPSALVNVVLQDEWSKAVGRIQPSAGTLFTRFRVNTSVNYDVVTRACSSFEASREGDGNLEKAHHWWRTVSNKVKKHIDERYVAMSRAHDSTAGHFGNPKVSSKVQGMEKSWRAAMSEKCVNDIKAAANLSETALLDMCVDDIMALAVLNITGGLLRLYAFTAFDAGLEPNTETCLQYVNGSMSNPPLDFYQFPRLFGDISSTKKEVLGNPMYDTSAMLVALCLFSASPDQRDIIIQKLQAGKEWLSPGTRAALALAAFQSADFRAVLASMGEDASFTALTEEPDIVSSM
eukprot:TRINITY_DN33464_c0_g1_i1.p1 TRINITY_DN33464_c0_g1~~TRINITY_DN33464_c0_g1_i1.p1  ORF type:complete len:1112 (-),score=159.34 TRINITY_DN33464_c0_g1_i1:230-3565(-)